MKPLLEAYPGASEEISNTQPQIVPKSLTQKPYDDPWQNQPIPLVHRRHSQGDDGRPYLRQKGHLALQKEGQCYNPRDDGREEERRLNHLEVRSLNL